MTTTAGAEILGLHLSPRKLGSSHTLLQHFAEGAARAGAKVNTVSVADLNIKGCVGCGRCSETGKCVIVDDDMHVIYKAWEGARRIVVSSSIFFYDMPSQGKAVLDRSQANWSKRYVLNQNKDDIPGAKGFLLACGATRGKELFAPITLAVKYLFDSLSFPKTYDTLFFRQIESPKSFSKEQLEEAEKKGFEFGSIPL